jgi:hypothetical protein
MRFSVLIIMLSFIVSCSTGSIAVKDDPFSKETVITYDKWHKVVEGPLDNLSTKYTRYIKQGIKSPVIVELEFRALAHPMSGYHAEDLDDNATILIDDVSIKVKIQNIKRNSSIFIGGMHGGGMSSFNINTINNLYGKFIIPPDGERLLLNSKRFMLRVSTGGKFTVLKATDGQLENIKKLLSVSIE